MSIQSDIDKVAFIASYKLLELFNAENGQDAITLYMFYQKQIPHQGTVSLWANNAFCMQGLKWAEPRFLKAKKLLKEKGFLSEAQSKGENGKMGKPFITLKSRLGKPSTGTQSKPGTGSHHAMVEPVPSQNQGVVLEGTNACSSSLRSEGNLNACSPSGINNSTSLRSVEGAMPSEDDPGFKSFSSDTGVPVPLPPSSATPPSKPYGNADVNAVLDYLRAVIGLTDFAESKSEQRKWAAHIARLGKAIGSEEFQKRLQALLDDPFKRKKLNKTAGIYYEIKGFIPSKDLTIPTF